MRPPSRSTRANARSPAPPAAPASKEKQQSGRGKQNAVRQSTAGPALATPAPAVPGASVPWNLKLIIGPKCNYPSVVYLVSRGFSSEQAHELRAALKALATFLRQWLLDHESGILMEVSVPGAIKEDHTRVVPGKVLKAQFYESDKHMAAGIYKTPVCVCLSFAGIRIEPNVKGIAHGVFCAHPAPQLDGILKELGVILLGPHLRSTIREDEARSDHVHAQFLTVRPHVLIPAPDGKAHIEVFRGTINPRKKKIGTEKVDVEPAEPHDMPSAIQPPVKEEKAAAPALAADPSPSSPELLQPVTSVSQPASQRLETTDTEWLPAAMDFSSFAQTETYAAAHAAELAVAAWRQSIAPVELFGEAMML